MNRLVSVPDFVYGFNGNPIGLIECDYQEKFIVTEVEMIKFMYYMKHKLVVNLITTAPKPKNSPKYNKLLKYGVKIFHVVKYKDLIDAVKTIVEDSKLSLNQ